jgi:hypothetical protein
MPSLFLFRSKTYVRQGQHDQRTRSGKKPEASGPETRKIHLHLEGIKSHGCFFVRA